MADTLYCHSRVGGNRDRAVRADASHAHTIADLLLGTMFYEHCATMGGSNFLDPIPACAGMTRAVYLCLFYDHSLCLGCGLSSPLARGVAQRAGVSVSQRAECREQRAMDVLASARDITDLDPGVKPQDDTYE